MPASGSVVHAMTVAITLLPRIVETLSAAVTQDFVILRYDEFVRFAVAASAGRVPDVVAVLDHADEHVFVILPIDRYRTYISTLDITGGVDEVHYLDKHKDVKGAIEQGRLHSGTQHYRIQGYFERREVRFPAVG
jgi:hypothetical protein